MTPERIVAKLEHVSPTRPAARAKAVASGSRSSGTPGGRPRDVVTVAQLEPYARAAEPFVQKCVDAYRDKGFFSTRMLGAVRSLFGMLGAVDEAAIRRDITASATRPGLAASEPRPPMPAPAISIGESHTSASKPARASNGWRFGIRGRSKKSAAAPPVRTDEMFTTFYGGKPK